MNSDSLRDSVGGGSSAEFSFSVTSKGHFFFFYFPGGGAGRTFFLFRDLKTSFSVNGALFGFFTFPKGGPGPPGPPPESATEQ